VNDTQEYKIALGSIARTFVYEDGLGVIIFAFDVNPVIDKATNKYRIYIGDRGLGADYKMMDNLTASGRDRVTLARQRTREFAMSRGYLVGA
jgi:hypothetical protein